MIRILILPAALAVLFAARLFAQNAGEAEAQKCEERIAAAVRDVLAKYDDSLTELQTGFQKAADLEGALAVRAEKQRVAQEGALTDKHLVAEPKSLRTLQSQVIARMQELTQQLVNDTVPKLVEYKKSLTIAGKLDDAVAVRTAIERLQNGYVPAVRAAPRTIVPAETLLGAYASDRTRADKIYKGQRIIVRGVVGGFRPDPADAKQYLLYLTGGNSGAWLQCAFSTNDFQFREEKQFNNTILAITGRGKDATTVRFQKGSNTDVSGVCDGLDELVRLSKCELER
jgi:hypothetical protein